MLPFARYWLQVKKAEELAAKHGWFMTRQFENEANPAYHRSTTGPEILQDFAGKRLDYFGACQPRTRVLVLYFLEGCMGGLSRPRFSCCSLALH